MKVQDFMTDHIITVGQLEPVTAAARLMRRHNLGALPVCDDSGRLRGVITDRDITTRCVAGDLDPASTAIREIMSRGVTTCRPDDDADDVLRIMSAGLIRRLPVTNGSKVIGMVSLADLARNNNYSMEAAEALGEISSNVIRR